MHKPKTPMYGGFLMLPHALLNCAKFRALSPIGVKMLLDIAGQYNGKNNGDLSAAWKVMQPKGWHSEATLSKAKKELLKAGFIAETRKGRLPNVCSLYGITWQQLNPTPKLDVGPGGFPYGQWIELPKLAGNRTSLATDSEAANHPIATDSEAVRTPIATDSEAMRREMAVS